MGTLKEHNVALIKSNLILFQQKMLTQLDVIYVFSTKKEYLQLCSQLEKEAVLSVFNLKNLLILAFTFTKLFLFYKEF